MGDGGCGGDAGVGVDYCGEWAWGVRVGEAFVGADVSNQFSACVERLKEQPAISAFLSIRALTPSHVRRKLVLIAPS